jgi:copper transport protein
VNDITQSRRLLRLLSVVFVALVMSVVGGAEVASAHNSLTDSNPQNGEVLTMPPTSWSVTFEKSVPLASASAIVVNSDGVRTTLKAPRHGATDKTVVFDLPSTLSGSVAARWRLVGSDGHVISGRVTFSVPTASVATTTTVAAGQQTSTTLPLDVSEEFADDEAFVAATPEPIRLSIRLGSFLALVLLGGILFTEVALSPGLLLTAVGRRLALYSSALLAIGQVGQYIVFVNDMKGATGTFSSALSDSLSMTLGTVFLFRATVAALLIVVLREILRRGGIDRVMGISLAATSGFFLLGQSLGGHSRTEEMPWLGVPVGMVHTAAIAVWMGGLVTVVFVVAPSGNATWAVDVFNRFGRFAGRAMALIIVTGVVQSARLHGGVSSLVSTSHGQLLLVKLTIFLLIVRLANRNRRVLFSAQSTSVDRPVATRREVVKASLTEVGLGIVVLLVSAAMVSASLL